MQNNTAARRPSASDFTNFRAVVQSAGLDLRAEEGTARTEAEFVASLALAYGDVVLTVVATS